MVFTDFYFVLTGPGTFDSDMFLNSASLYLPSYSVKRWRFSSLTYDLKREFKEIVSR